MKLEAKPASLKNRTLLGWHLDDERMVAFGKIGNIVYCWMIMPSTWQQSPLDKPT